MLYFGSVQGSEVPYFRGLYYSCIAWAALATFISLNACRYAWGCVRLKQYQKNCNELYVSSFCTQLQKSCSHHRQVISFSSYCFLEILLDELYLVQFPFTVLCHSRLSFLMVLICCLVTIRHKCNALPNYRQVVQLLRDSLQVIRISSGCWSESILRAV